MQDGTGYGLWVVGCAARNPLKWGQVSPLVINSLSYSPTPYSLLPYSQENT